MLAEADRDPVSANGTSPLYPDGVGESHDCQNGLVIAFVVQGPAGVK